MEREDILENKFFLTLQKDYASLYAQVQSNLWVVLVPQAVCLPGQITRELIETHILRPSPFFKSVYEVVSQPDKTVEFDDQVIHTQTGFPSSRTVNILFEETFYNKHYNPFSVFCIDQPLIGGSKKPSVDNLLPPVVMPSPKQFAESMDYLKAFPENELVLKKIDKLVDEFSSTYVLLKGYEQDAHSKVAVLVETAFEQLLCTNMFFRKMQNNPRQLRDVSMIIESYVMLGLFHKLCSGLRELNDAEDLLITEINSGHRSNGTSLLDFGVRLDLKSSDFCKATAVLDELDYCKTPLQMLYTLQGCVDALSSILSNYFANHKGTDPITTDDMIPIIAYTVAQSPFRYFESTLTYIEHFTFEDNSNSELGYNFTNFKAALSYLSDPTLKPMSLLKQNNIKIREPRRMSKTILTPRLGLPPSTSPTYGTTISLNGSGSGYSLTGQNGTDRPPNSPSPQQLKASSQKVLESQSAIDAILLKKTETASSSLFTVPNRPQRPKAAISIDP